MLRPTVGFEFEAFGNTGCLPEYFEHGQMAQKVRQLWDAAKCDWVTDQVIQHGVVVTHPDGNKAHSYHVNFKSEELPAPLFVRYLGKTLTPPNHPKIVDCSPRVEEVGETMTIFRYAVVPQEES